MVVGLSCSLCGVCVCVVILKKNPNLEKKKKIGIFFKIGKKVT